MIKLVIFDFDGVIVDSAHECFVICEEVAKRLGWKSIDRLEKQFLQARSFVLAAEDYYYIVKSFDKELNIDFSNLTQEEYEKLKISLSGNVKPFVDLFYKIRYDMQSKDMDIWFKLHGIYPGMKEAFTEISSKYKTVIATAKDTKSTFELLNSIGLELKEDQINGREFSKEKVEKIKKVIEIFKLKPEEIFFIEDMLQNLQPVLDIGVKGCLVSWGYSNKTQKEEARKLGILIEKPEEIIKRVEKG